MAYHSLSRHNKSHHPPTTTAKSNQIAPLYCPLLKYVLPLIVYLAVLCSLIMPHEALANKLTDKSTDTSKKLPTYYTIYNDTDKQDLHRTKQSPLDELPNTATNNTNNATNNVNITNNIDILLVGLIVNGKEIDSIDALHIGKSYYVSFDILLQQLGITPVLTNNEYVFDTPIGTGNISQSYIVPHKTVDYLPISALKSIGVSGVYDSDNLAIKLYIPWNKSQLQAKTVKTDIKQKIDTAPESFGVTNVELSGGYDHNYSKTIYPSKLNNTTLNDPKSTNIASSNSSQKKHNHNASLNGYLFGGLWGADIKYHGTINNTIYDDVQENNQPEVSNLFWVKAGENNAVRLGTNNAGYGLTGNQYTGLTYGYSNQSIKKHLTTNLNGSSKLLGSSGNDSSQNIKGIGPAGGIAELRVNQTAIARARIGLDGKYEFIGLNVDNSGGLNRLVEVAIYEYSLTAAPIKIDTPNLARRVANVNTGEVVIEAGVGAIGNVINSNHDSHANNANTSISGHAYAEYGLKNNIAVRGAVSSSPNSYANSNKDGNDNTTKLQSMAGINIGLPLNINFDLALKNLVNKNIYDTHIDYIGDDINASYNYQLIDVKTNPHSSAKIYKKEDKHNLNIRYSNPNSRFSLGGRVTHLKKDEKADDYFSAGIRARLKTDVNLNISRDRYNDYRYGLNWRIPMLHSNLAYSWDKNSQIVAVDTKVNPALGFGVSVNNWHKNNKNAYYSYANYKTSDKSTLNTSIGLYDNLYDYGIAWEYNPNDYSSFSLGYQKNQASQNIAENFDTNNDTNNDIEIHESDFFYLRYNLNFVNNKSSRFKLGSYSPSYYGSLITNINMKEAKAGVLDDKIQLILNEESVDAEKINDFQYIVRDVKPGVYKLKFPTDSLPIEYKSNNHYESIIKIANATPTIVDYNFAIKYGFTGQLQTKKKGVEIQVFQNGSLVTQTKTNAFGFYQVIGLPAGTYELKTAGRPSKTVTINNAIVFNVNI